MARESRAAPAALARRAAFATSQPGGSLERSSSRWPTASSCRPEADNGSMEAAGSTHAAPGATTDRAPKRRPAPGALARLASDERLVARVRTGTPQASETAFSILWERYHRQLLSYCRHMLGSHHEAEDAVQQVFANA